MVHIIKVKKVRILQIGGVNVIGRGLETYVECLTHGSSLKLLDK